jgi:phosphatidylinositol N-acetylglucosaminyltransferase subunit H
MLTTTPYLHVRRPSPTTTEFTVSTQPPMTLTLRFLLTLVHAGRLVLAFAVLLLVYAKWTKVALDTGLITADAMLTNTLAMPMTTPTIQAAAASMAITPKLAPSRRSQNHHNQPAAYAPAPRPQRHSLPAAAQQQQPEPCASIFFPPAGSPLSEPYVSLAAAAAMLTHILTTTRAGRVLGAMAAATPAYALAPVCALLLFAASRRVHTSESLLVLRGLGLQTGTSGGSVLTAAFGGGRGWGVTRFIPTEKIQDVLINEGFRGFEVRYYLVVVVEGEDDVVVVFPRLLPRRAIVEKVWRGVRRCLLEVGPREKGASANGNGVGAGRKGQREREGERITRTASRRTNGRTSTT